MRDKHLNSEKDMELLRSILKAVGDNFQPGKEMSTSLLFKFAFYLVLTLTAYSSLYFIDNSTLFLVAFILYGLFSLLFAFNFAHDFSHDTIFKSKKWNNRAFIALYSIVGAHAESWKERHISSHHFAPNVEEYDTDLQITGVIRVIPNSSHRWYHRFQHIYAPLAYTTYSLFWVFVKDFVIYFGEDRKPRSYHWSFWLQKTFYLTYILGLPLLFSGQRPMLVLAAFLAMHLVQSLFLLFTFFMTHHVENTSYPKTDSNGIIKSSWVMNQIQSSNDMHPFSPMANFILGGFNNHIAHHLFPHIHHIHYPKLNRILYHVLNENGIQPNQTSYLGGIISHLRLLRMMGRNESSKPIMVEE